MDQGRKLESLVQQISFRGLKIAIAKELFLPTAGHYFDDGNVEVQALNLARML